MYCMHSRGAVGGASHPLICGFDSRLMQSARRSVLGQDTEPQITPPGVIWGLWDVITLIILLANHVILLALTYRINTMIISMLRNSWY